MPRPKKDRAYNREVGRRIRAIREDLGMGQIDFLDYLEEKAKVRYAQSALSGIENGDKWITADDVRVFGSLIPGGTDELLHGRRSVELRSTHSVESTPQNHDPKRLPPTMPMPGWVDPAAARALPHKKRRGA
jgi:hypothetical protein